MSFLQNKNTEAFGRKYSLEIYILNIQNNEKMIAEYK